MDSCALMSPIVCVPARALETVAIADMNTGDAFAISCPVKLTARNGAGAGLRCAGAERSQWHFAGGQQFMPRDKGCLQEASDDSQAVAGTEVPMSEVVSKTAKNLKITCID